MNCFRASLNIENIEIWSSDLFYHKKDVLLDIKTSLIEISKLVQDFSILTEDEIKQTLKSGYKFLKEKGTYKNKEQELDFFIYEMEIWESIAEKKIFIEKHKSENYGIK